MSHSPSEHRNRLADETSPYLLQHATHPVAWHPWDDTALALAREQDKPILLSIGYSACHWCHVMAHESFADPQVAAVMNELFVNIKVDREERPDLDRIYQIAHQMLTRRGGGWPLTMFLSPHDQRPFFGGTYFPKEARQGWPSFTDLLRRVAEFYRTRRDDVTAQNAALQQALDELTLPPPASDFLLSAAPLLQARTALGDGFDGEYGGFGTAPKFPQPTSLEFLLRRWRASAATDAPDLHSLYMASLTLTRMAEGGLFDHLGGGFMRYAVDRAWRIPHFEKMLYDNAQLLDVFAQAASATGETLFATAAERTAEWLVREMQSPHGGYWSALDADSEGEEGKYYVWTGDELRTHLSPSSTDVVMRRFGLDQPPNFEGRWHLVVHRTTADIAAELGLELKAVEQTLESGRNELLAARAARARPARDEKILTAWNGLTIGAMAVAARVLQRDDLAESAQRAVDCVRSSAWRGNTLYAVCKDPRWRLRGYLDDYAFLLNGLIELLQTRWRDSDLVFAIELADALLQQFEDTAPGGFFFTAHNHETLIHRTKSFTDESLPSGNAVAAQALNKLGLLLGETRYLEAARRTLHAAWLPLQQHPHGCAALLVALEEQLEPLDIVIIRGEAAEADAWRDALHRIYAPRRLVLSIPNNAQLPEGLAVKAAASHTIAYVCRGTTCSPPAKSLAALIALTRH